MRIRLKDDVRIEELEKYGFKDGVFKRELDKGLLYTVVITKHHRLIQIRFGNAHQGCIAGSLQCLLYDMISDGIIEKI